MGKYIISVVDTNLDGYVVNSCYVGYDNRPTDGDFKTFDTEEEAREWLLSEEAAEWKVETVNRKFSIIINPEYEEQRKKMDDIIFDILTYFANGELEGYTDAEIELINSYQEEWEALPCDIEGPNVEQDKAMDALLEKVAMELLIMQGQSYGEEENR